MRALARLMAVGRLIALAAGIAAMSSAAWAYSHWIFLPTPSAPVSGRFDLTALTDNTVNYFISDVAPAALMPGDSMTAIYSQIHHAAEVWNGVPTSSLRLHFGGVAPTGAPQTAPGIEVVFDDNMPPGIIAQTRPTFPADLSFLKPPAVPPGSLAPTFIPPTFVPMLRSKVQFRSNLAVAGVQQISYTDSFFLTAVHEFGHAVGLQHSMTSAVMSTAITRATMRGAPLAADDIASVSLLYPVAGYAASTGTITGIVTLAGVGMNMASVVAISLSGTAVGALTNPDGTYRIDGLPPGQYMVYAHPLPPAQYGEASPANIFPPVDATGKAYPADIGFDTSFFPFTKDWTKAAQIPVAAGQSVGPVYFTAAARPGPVIYGMETYGYIDGGAVPEPPLTGGTQGNPMVFYSPGTTVNNQTAMAPGLNVSVIGGAAAIEPATLRYYVAGFVLMYLDTAKVAAPTPVALAVNLGDDLYVLPQAFTVETVNPPSITQVTPGTAADGSAFATITGAGLGALSKILFDGAPAAIQSINADGSLVVIPPPAPGAYLATVEAVNPDGQTSLQSIGTAAVPVYPYAVSNAASIAVQPAVATAGTDVMLTISGANTHFADGQTIVGVGVSDITVRRVWVVNQNLILLNATIGGGADIGPVNLTVSTGLEIVTRPAAITVQVPGVQQISLRVPVINAFTGLAGVPAGGLAALTATGLPADLTGWTLTIGGVPSPFSGYDGNSIIVAVVPATLALGPRALQMIPPAGAGPAPIAMQLDAPPPVIVAAFDNATSTSPVFAVGPSSPAKGGDMITLDVSALGAGLPAVPAASAVWIAVGSVTTQPISILPASGGIAQVQFILPTALPYNPATTRQTVAVSVGTGTRLSAAYALDIQVTPPAAPATGP
ncbi:MAG TPA: matrixin family metalloprotease [Bryobacteraceae bacterium]|nr:matrixin family metalloprotease [Bryobacteraceae bacterium]